MRGDLVYLRHYLRQAYIPTFHQKLVQVKYNACLARKGAIRDTSKENLYGELG